MNSAQRLVYVILVILRYDVQVQHVLLFVPFLSLLACRVDIYIPTQPMVEENGCSSRFLHDSNLVNLFTNKISRSFSAFFLR